MSCLFRFKVIVTAGLLVGLLLLTSHVLYAAGLTVEPGGLLIQHVTPGEVYDIFRESGVAIRIYNRLDKTSVYRISARKPSSAGRGRWKEGYKEIPDAEWLYFDRTEVSVGPQGMEEVKVFIRIPAVSAYFNQRWAVTVSVEGQPSEGDVFTMAAYLPFEIETEAESP